MSTSIEHQQAQDIALIQLFHFMQENVVSQTERKYIRFWPTPLLLVCFHTLLDHSTPPEGVRTLWMPPISKRPVFLSDGPLKKESNFKLTIDNMTLTDVDLKRLGGLTKATSAIVGNSLISSYSPLSLLCSRRLRIRC